MVGLFTGSLYLQNRANNKALKARSRYLEEERMRQDGFQEKQRMAADNSIDNLSIGSVNGRTNDEKMSILSDFDRATDIKPVGLGVSSSKSDNSLVGALARQDAKRNSDRKMALAALLSSGGALSSIAEDNAFNAADISRFANFSRGSLNANTYELDHARTLGKSGLAELLWVLGQAALSGDVGQSPAQSTNTPVYQGNPHR